MEKSKINMGKTKRTYLESLWGGPHGENQTNFVKNKNLGNTKKTYSETLGLPSPIPKTSGKLFFLYLFVFGFSTGFYFFNVFWSMFFGFSFFLVFPFWFSNVFGFSNIFSVFSMGPSPKSFQIFSPGFSNVYFCFLHVAFPKESQIFFWCFPAYNVVHKKKQQKSNGKTACVSSGWLESHREGRHLDQTYYVHVCFAGMGKR